MAKRNFLLGKGERLTEQVRVPSGGVDKVSPYTFAEARQRLQPMLQNVVAKIENLPPGACPDDIAVATLTLNPEFIAKTYFPAELLRTVGLDTIGSRARQIKPEKKSKGREPEEAVTTELFVMGKKQAFQRWARELPTWTEYASGVDQIVEIEEIAFPTGSDKLKSTDKEVKMQVFEVVLHLTEGMSETRYLNLFKTYLRSLNIDPSLDRRFYASGLCFLELEAPTELAEQIAAFSFVRVLRSMPSLRFLQPAIRVAGPEKTVGIKLPNVEVKDPDIKVAIFDGGIPTNHPICKWAIPMEIPNMQPAEPEMLEHGVGVTSAFLFGHLNPGQEIPQPFCSVDHYRVLDNTPGQRPWELYEVLDRINNVLKTKKYDFINLSLGPRLPIEDNEVHAWTAVLDEYLSKGETLATIAVGNDGEADTTLDENANRVQVPADCVNALSVGACDVPDANWQRAPYSSIGPGRSPGLIKPDLVAFGGSIQRPFLTLDLSGKNLFPTGGTSFAAPSTLRMGTGVRAHFGNSLNALAIRTLLIHCAEGCDISKNEVGWGRVARNLDDIVVCEDHIMRVVYQGTITASKYIRVPIPLPSDQLKGMVKIKVTLCYATAVDPHHPGNYTRSGLSLTFRPNKDNFKTDKKTNKTPLHAASKSFFGKSQKAYQSEEELRRDAWKWENCLHAERSLRGDTLKEPIFDIHYNARFEGQNDTRSREMQYALVITVEAPKVSDLYDQVVRRYATHLEPLVPVIDIPLRTS